MLSSACGLSSEHLNHKKHTMAKSVYRYHMYYHVRRVLKRLRVELPNEAGFSADDNPYSNAGFFKICEDYEVPHDPMRYGRMKSSFKRTSMGVGQDYINQDSMTRWIIEKSQGFTDVGLLRISESIRVYA